MIKPQKIIQYLILISILYLFIKCSKDNYIKNKYRIVSVNLTVIDSNKTFIKFGVEYYSDSTQKNMFSSSIEKGIDGSNEEILFLGKNGEASPLEIQQLIENLNANRRGFRGEKVERGYIINGIYKNLILVRNRNSVADTIEITAKTQL